MGNILSQFFFIPPAPLTEKNCPDQSNRVFLITGGYAGVGFELSKILYAHNAIVYIAGRSASKAESAIKNIKSAAPTSKGKVEFLELDLADLSTIKGAVEIFKEKEGRLDVLVNNAGVMFPPAGSLTPQSHDLQIGTNCLGHSLLTSLLLPLLTTTASTSLTASVRVLWAGSIAVHVAAPKPSGMSLEPSGRPKDLSVRSNYAQSKVGNVFLAKAGAKKTKENGVVHVAFNPGNLRTELQRNWKGVDHWVTDKFILYTAIHGAYTELWSALAPELTPDKSGSYVYPWGRFGSLPAGVEKAESDGTAAKFVEWCDTETAAFR